MTSHPAPAPPPQVAILVLNYHQPETTLACIQSLLRLEGPGSRVIWIENEASRSGSLAEQTLVEAGVPWLLLNADAPSLPPSGTVGLLLIPENLGYAGGNNAGLRLAHRLQVPFAWVLNNDTLLEQGSSLDLIRAAESRPEIALWGTRMRHGTQVHVGGRIDPATAYSTPLHDPEGLRDANTFVSGGSLFLSLPVAAEVGFLPEQYFLYYEDAAFSMKARAQGKGLGVVQAVLVQHHESLTTGRRSALVEYYNKRNRWWFMREFFPELLEPNRRRLAYTLQKYLLRFRLRRAWLEWLAYRDFQKGVKGRTRRDLRGTT